MTTYKAYAYAVINGDITSGELMRQSARRFIDDLSRDDLEFREDEVERAICFISKLKHYKGKHAGTAFILEPWQQFIIANIVGFYWIESGRRRFTSSYIEISRKQGKTALAVAICLYFFIADGERGAEVILAANAKDQAKIAFDMAVKFARSLDPKGKRLTSQRADILFPATDSVLKVIASDDKTLDGFNASFGLVDEYHAAPTSKVRDVIQSSMGMRENPHLCTITTAGFDKSKPCYQLRTVATEILAGVKDNDAIFAAIYSLDDDDDWQDATVWAKSNPNLNITVTEKFIREQVHNATTNPSEEVGVRTKTLNQWCDSATVWIPDKYLLSACRCNDLDEFKDMFCYVGVDLGATSDLTAVTAMIVIDDEYYYKTWYYLPESALIEKADREMYKEWRRNGQLIVTPGNVTDYDYITNDLMQLNEVCMINNIFYDKYNATQWAIKVTELGLPMQEYSQSLLSFNHPTKEMERQLLQGKAIIDINDITLFCFRNVTLKCDHNGNVKPVKNIDKRKIDGVISMLSALGGYLMSPHYTNTI